MKDNNHYRSKHTDLFKFIDSCESFYSDGNYHISFNNRSYECLEFFLLDENAYTDLRSMTAVYKYIPLGDDLTMITKTLFVNALTLYLYMNEKNSHARA